MNERIGFGLRLGAYLIDFVVIGIVGGILGVVVGGVLGAGAGAAVGAGGESGDAAAAAVVAGAMGAVFGFAIGFGLVSIGWIAWEGLTGQALGKKLLKIRIKAEDGANAGTDKLLTRAAVKYSPSILTLIYGLTRIGMINTLSSLAGLVIFVGCLMVLGQKRQAIHDMVAKTAVFKA